MAFVAPIDLTTLTPAERRRETARRFGQRLRIFGWGLAALSALATLTLVLFPAAAPYALYAVYSAPSNTVIPLYNEPGLLFFAPGSVAWVLALVAMPGVALGAVLDYALVGRALDSPRLDRLRQHRSARWVMGLFGRIPALTIFACALLPAPFWLVRILATASGYPLARYVAAVLPGRFLRYLVVATLGRALGVPPEVGLWALGIMAVYLVWVMGQAAVRGWTRARTPSEADQEPAANDELTWIIEQAVSDAAEPSRDATP
ncbi:MAG: VTT domain-containing protein [Myxococcota bacterium]